MTPTQSPDSSIDRDLVATLRRADPNTSRFQPLAEILTFDDFDRGHCGWTELIGNYVGTLDTVRPLTADLRPPQLSNCTFFDIGSHGALSGNYALKLATRPVAGHRAAVVKRMTMPAHGLVQFEMYFTYKPEAILDSGVNDAGWDGNEHPSEGDFGRFTLGNDIGGLDDGQRFICGLRYENADPDGNLIQQWVYPTTVHPTTKMQLNGKAPDNVTDLHSVTEHDWQAVDGAHQPLCYNEVPTKINWHYLRWRFDTTTRRNVELQVGDRIYDLSGVEVPLYDERYAALRGLLNFTLDVQTRRNVRNFLYVDSIMISGEW
jgi:hypothetical protein